MKIVVDVVVPPLQEHYSYFIPSELEHRVGVGSRVEIEFGRRNTLGYVVSKYSSSLTSSSKGFTLKPIRGCSSTYNCFDQTLLRFYQSVADYYGEPLPNVIEAAIPPQVTQKYRESIRLLKPPESFGRSKKLVDLIEKLSTTTTPLFVDEIRRGWPGVRSMLNKLQTEGCIQIESHEILSSKHNNETRASWAKTAVDLNLEQQAALAAIVDQIEQGEFKSFLLHGVTGSGKTEVYIEAISSAIKSGKGALIIVPEIALTPQMIDRFAARFQQSLAILHSGMNKRERWNSWRMLIEGSCQIAIGVRSSVFAPVPNLGLIIVDEEHDSSYKQADGLRYNARDLAVLRASMIGCPVVLGTATPSLETFNNAKTSKYKLLKLNSRYSNAIKPKSEIVDLRQLKPWQMPSKNISPQLHDGLAKVIARNEQAFILYNRRGFASFLQCENCAAVLGCPNCSVTLTYHQVKNTLICHYCGLAIHPPTACNQCTPGYDDDGELKSNALTQRGAGTERIYDEIKSLFPGVEVERLDRDAISTFEEYSEVLRRMRSGSTQILVGTQMIAKGHDLPNVTLVGIVDCDVGLHFPDFRSAERVFQLLTQASGRAGRHDKPGEVILQTRMPSHRSVKMAVTQDYDNFALLELKSRYALNYPPFSRLLRIVVSGEEASSVEECIREIANITKNLVRNEQLQVDLLGPAPAAIVKIKARWRWSLMIRSKSVNTLNKILIYLRAAKIRSKKNRVSYDMDPQDML